MLQPQANFSRKVTVLHAIDTPILPFCVAFFVAFLLSWSVLQRNNFDARHFINAGANWSDARVLGNDFPVKRDSGFDGQFYYRLAINPFTDIRSAYGVTLDNPAYRHQRIFYPLLAWCFSLGQPALLPWALIGLNIAAFCAIGWSGGWWAKELGRHAIWGVLLLLHVGFAVSLSYDLTEIIEIAFLLGALAFAHRKAWTSAAILFCCALLSKETAVPFALFAVMAIGVQSWRNWRIERGTWWLLLPMAIYVLIQIILRDVWGEFPSAAGKSNVGVPFEALKFRLFPLFSSGITLNIEPLQLWLFLLFIVAALYQMRFSPIAYFIKASWMFCVVLFISLTDLVFVRDIHFTRAFSEIYAVGTLFFFSSSFCTRAVLLTITLSIFVLRISLPI